MNKIAIVIGTRPNFMKSFPVYEALKNDFNVTLIHTGQHYSPEMSDVFFKQLGFPKPDLHFELTSRTKAGDFDEKLYQNNTDYIKNLDNVVRDLLNYDSKKLGQLGEIKELLKKEFSKNKPDLVMVFGDCTNTLASALTAKELDIPIAHIESGLRSGDLSMPEEVNRILTDHITKYYFVTERSGVDNLKSEGITENIYLVGNTMIDTQKKFLPKALATEYCDKIGVKKGEYVLITLHRPSNVDNLEKLKEIFDDFEKLSKKETLVYPIHPRTKNNLEKLGYLDKIRKNTNIILTEPLGYLEFTCLITNSKYVVTDSGGIQEETTALDISCFTLRPNTERPSTFIKNNGTNKLINNISEIELKKCKGNMALWDGNSSKRICNWLIENKIKTFSSCLRRGTSASHRYRENIFPWSHLLFQDEVFAEYYKKYLNKKVSASTIPSWVNGWIPAHYGDAFKQIGYDIVDLKFTGIKWDDKVEQFYQRFINILRKFTKEDLVHQCYTQPLKNLEIKLYFNSTLMVFLYYDECFL